jgi:hypothetical protein
MRITAVLAVPLALSIVVVIAVSSGHVNLGPDIVVCMLLAIALWYSYQVWQKGSVEVLDTVRSRVYPVSAPKKVTLATIAFVAASALLLYDGTGSTFADFKYSVLILSLAPYLGYLAFLFFPQYSEAYTDTAKAEFARLKMAEAIAEQERQQKGARRTWFDDVAENLWARWYIRYSCGIALLWASAACAKAEKGSIVLAILLALNSLYCLKEVAAVVLGLSIAGGLLYALFGVVAGIPVSVAIIIGALIIANSRNR